MYDVTAGSEATATTADLAAAIVGLDPQPVVHSFPDPDALPAALAPANEAGLRQFSRERLIGYGLCDAEATELRRRIGQGEGWLAAALAMARRIECATQPPAPVSAATRREHLFSMAALLRASQLTELADTDDRREVYLRAATIFAEALLDEGGRRTEIDTPAGRLTGWLFGADAGAPRPGVAVIGGVEGWAMDFAVQARALAKRGMLVLALDGPGQGETRFLHGHFLRFGWAEAYSAAVRFLKERAGGKIGFIGNSMGGAFATLMAGRDPTIAAVCNNGAPPNPIVARERATFFLKMAGLCGPVGEAEAVAIWRDLEITRQTASFNAAYLQIHGGRDKLVSLEEMRRVYETVQSPDKTLHVFSDGDHCIYNHLVERDQVIGDWFAAKLGALAC